MFRCGTKNQWLIIPGIAFIWTIQCFGHGDIHSQIEGTTLEIQANAKDAQLYHKRGELHRVHGEFAQALTDYTKAEQLDPGLDVVFLSRGRAFFEIGSFLDAQSALNQFLTRQPDHALGLLYRARTRSRLGHRVQAENDFARTIELTEKPTPEVSLERADNLNQAGELDAALRCLNEGIKRIGSAVTLETAALEQELKLGMHNKAIQRLDTLMQQAGRKETYLKQRGEILEKMGRPDAAREAYQQALSELRNLSPHLRRSRRSQALELELLSLLKQF